MAFNFSKEGRQPLAVTVLNRMKAQRLVPLAPQKESGPLVHTDQTLTAMGTGGTWQRVVRDPGYRINPVPGYRLPYLQDTPQRRQEAPEKQEQREVAKSLAGILSAYGVQDKLTEHQDRYWGGRGSIIQGISTDAGQISAYYTLAAYYPSPSVTSKNKNTFDGIGFATTQVIVQLTVMNAETLLLHIMNQAAYNESRGPYKLYTKEQKKPDPRAQLDPRLEYKREFKVRPGDPTIFERAKHGTMIAPAIEQMSAEIQGALATMGEYRQNSQLLPQHLIMRARKELLEQGVPKDQLAAYASAMNRLVTR